MHLDRSLGGRGRAARRGARAAVTALGAIFAAAACASFGGDDPPAPAEAGAPPSSVPEGGAAPSPEAGADATGSEDGGPDGSVPAGMVVVNPEASAPLRFAIDRTEVTVAQFEAFLASAPPAPTLLPGCGWKTVFGPAAECARATDPNAPMVCVDHCDAAAFCADAGKRLCGKPGGGPSPFATAERGQDSQWMWACAGGPASEGYPYGPAYAEGACNLVGDGGAPKTVGSSDRCRAKSGALDLSGNVWEWEDACVPSQEGRASCRIRGGAAASTPAEGTCGYLTDLRSDSAYEDVGFRCCADL